MIVPAIRRMARPVEELTVHPRNDHHQGDVGAICQSLERFGQLRPILVQKSTGYVVAGNHVLLAARALGWPKVAAVVTEMSDEDALAYLVADNRLPQLGTFDDQGVADLLGDLVRDGGLEGTGYDGEDLDRLLADIARDAVPVADQPTPISLADRFLVPPFSVLDARSGWWRDRKRAWRAAGIRSEEGRAEDLLGLDQAKRDPLFYAQKKEAEADLGRELTTAEFVECCWESSAREGTVNAAGTSMFDPVLAELALRWFTAEGDLVLDPLAGGSVRGLVAATLGRRYVGIDLQAEQLEENRRQATALAPEVMPEWFEGDARDAAQVLAGLGPFDACLSCPPYFNLERYSDDERDLSAASTYEAFLGGYLDVIRAAVALLRDDAFIVWVVGEIRDAHGLQRGLVADTVDAFRAAGAGLYNEAVLVTPISTLPLVSARPFVATRVLARAHQSVLIFVKGDRRRAAARLGEVDVSDALAVLPERWVEDPGVTVNDPDV